MHGRLVSRCKTGGQHAVAGFDGLLKNLYLVFTRFFGLAFTCSLESARMQAKRARAPAIFGVPMRVISAQTHNAATVQYSTH